MANESGRAKRSHEWEPRVQELLLAKLEGATLSDEEQRELNDVPRPTQVRWTKTMLEFGMTPIEWANFEKKRRRSEIFETRLFDAETSAHLVRIVEKSPDLYLDEIQDDLEVVSGKRMSLSSLSTHLDSLGFSMQVMGQLSRNQDEVARLRYANALNEVEDPKMLIFVDESAKDKNSARRRRGWGRKGRGLTYRVTYERWCQDRYTFIAAMDINGFVHEACECIMRKEGEGDDDDAAGTVNRERFEHWVEFYLVPILGRWAEGQPRSMVVLDNSTNHTGPRTIQLIQDAGARLIFTAPNAADLNPIEYCFHVYKSDLRRTTGGRRGRHQDYITSTEEAHLHAMQAVTPEIARAEYRHLRGAIRNVPSDNQAEEEEEENEAVAVVIAVLLLSDFI